MANTSCSRVPALRWRTRSPNPKPELRRPKEIRNPKPEARARAKPPNATRLSTQRRQGATAQRKTFSEAWLGASTASEAGPIRAHQLRALAPWRLCVNCLFSGLHGHGLTPHALERFRAIHSTPDRDVAAHGRRAADGIPGLQPLAHLVAAAMTPFNPGAGPPPTKIP